MASKPRILIIDDEEIVRLNIERILEQEYEVKTTSSGEQALQMIRNEEFDLVLSDLVMEDMDGFKLLEEIKRYSPELVVIIITGYGSLPSAIAAMQRGAYDYILKPCSKEELLVRVKKGLEKGALDKKWLQVKQMETMLANMGIFIIDKNGVIVSAHPGLSQRFWGEQDVVGQKLLALPGLVETGLAGDLAAALEGGDLEQEEVKLQRHNPRQELIISYHLKPLDLKEGRVKNLIWIVEDITKRKHLMQQISQAEKLTSLGKLAAGVAHEINNPLNIISLDVECVKGQLEPDHAAQENLVSIGEEVDRIAQIVQQLQDQSRAQESLQECSNLKEILDSHIFQILFDQLHKKGITVKLSLDEEQKSLLIPKSKLIQVLMNLVKNAEDAMSGNNGGTLTITCSSISPGQTRGAGGRVGVKRDKLAQITLSDTGVGIKKEHQANVFEPFFTTKGFAGTGLGLFISYTLIKGYQGDLQVESEENKGTTFMITLPLAEAKEAAHEA